MAQRQASVERNTLETQIQVKVNLDGSGECNLDTGVPFLEHMLDQVARHGLIDLEITAKGDLHIDAHHTVEDIGITLGQAVSQALGDKKASCDTVMLTFLWMKPCRVWLSIFPVVRDWSITLNFCVPVLVILMLTCFTNFSRVLSTTPMSHYILII